MVGVVKGQRVTGPQRGAARALRGRQTPAEGHLWQHLRANGLDGHHFRRQQPIGPYIVDFCCAPGRLVVEVDGPIHQGQVDYDRERDDFLAAHGLRVLRFGNDAILHRTASVLSSIRHALATASPPSPPQGGGWSPQRPGGVLKEHTMPPTIADTSVQSFPALDLDNGLIAVTVVPDLGGKFASLRDLRSGREWLWTSDTLPYARVGYDAADPNHYVRRGDFGGWDECFPSVAHCAYPLAPWRGRPVQDHGELWSQPWRAATTRGDDGGVALALAADGVAFPYTFRRTLTLRPDSATLRLDYAVENTGGDPFAYIWSAHPLLRLERGMRVELPPGTIMHLNGVGRGGDDTPEPGEYPWPPRAGGLDLAELPPPGAGVSCKLWSRPLAAGWVRLSAPGGTLNLAFDPALLPQVGLWVNAGGWSGTGGAPYNNLGLEPCSGAQDSLADAVERFNLYRTLAPGETHRWWLEVTLSEG